jgi:hypothetical protein
LTSLTGKTAIRTEGFQFVASGIDGTLSSPPKLCAGEAKDVSKGELWETESSSPFGRGTKGDCRIEI